MELIQPTTFFPEKQEFNPKSQGVNVDVFETKISGDGNVLAVLGMCRYSNYFSVFMYRKVNGFFIQDGVCTLDDQVSGDHEGACLSLNNDGSVLALGMPNKFKNAAKQGAVYIFTKADGYWKTEQKLYAHEYAEGNQFGYSIHLSSTGSLLLIGEPGHDENNGRFQLWRMTRIGIYNAIVVQAGNEQGARFGSAVSADGDFFVFTIGEENAKNEVGTIGRVHVIRYSGGSITEQLSVIKGSVDLGTIGSTVTMSEEGTTIFTQGKNKEGLSFSAIYVRVGVLWRLKNTLVAANAEDSRKLVAFEAAEENLLQLSNEKIVLYAKNETTQMYAPVAEHVFAEPLEEVKSITLASMRRSIVVVGKNKGHFHDMIRVA